MSILLYWKLFMVYQLYLQNSEDQETRILKNYSDILNTDVLKVGHHGRTSSGDEFMTIATPDISIVSLGEKKIG